MVSIILVFGNASVNSQESSFECSSLDSGQSLEDLEVLLQSKIPLFPETPGSSTILILPLFAGLLAIMTVMFVLSLALGGLSLLIQICLAAFSQPRLVDFLRGAFAIFGGAFVLVGTSTILTLVLKALVALFT